MLEFLSYFSILLIIFYIVTLWKFAVKTGRPGWSLFIPIYSNYVWVSIAGMDSIWCLLSFVPSIVTRMYPDNYSISIAAYIFGMIVLFYFCRCLANRFNKGIGYAFGLFLLNPIFLAILTFNKKCYYYRGF